MTSVLPKLCALASRSSSDQADEPRLRQCSGMSPAGDYLTSTRIGGLGVR
jgi:hypothetical protein